MFLSDFKAIAITPYYLQAS